MSTTRAVVIGGGLAGLAAAIRLASRGHEVVLFEGRARLGGATHSFQRTGLSVDNGQHVFLRCYDEYRAFLSSIGSSHLVDLQDRFDIPVLTPGGPGARLYRGRGMPAPLHLTSCLSRYSLLSMKDRLKVVSAAMRLRRLDVTDDRLDRRSFGSWLREQRQSDASMAAMWDLLIVAALNTRCEDASLQLAVKVFQTALLTRAPAADIGIPQVPLATLHAEPAAKALTAAGGRIFLRTKVTGIQRGDNGFVVHTEKDTCEAGIVIIATPHTQAANLLPEGSVPHRDRLGELGHSPIVNAHFVFDRDVTDLQFSAATGSPIQWTFDRSRIAGLGGSGQYLAVSLSAASDLIEVPTAEIRERLLPEFVRLFPRAAKATLTDFFVTRERHATFSQSPGNRWLRPRATTRVPGLYLAGAWTDTGWPDTMEGAVRSGNEAASKAAVAASTQLVGGRSR